MRSWILIAIAVAAPASADSWRMPEHKTVRQGDYKLQLEPGPVGASKTTTAKLKLERAGKLVYERAAVNHVAPAEVFVAADGHVATVGDWHSFGYDHSLVIYNPRGDIVIDRRLEELLAGSELAKTEHSVSSRWWIARGKQPVIAGGELVVPAIWGAELRFRLRDGAQLRDGKPFVVPTDEERYAGYATGARKWTTARISFGESDDDDGGMSCTLGVAVSECAPFGTTARKAVTKRYALADFNRALAATTAFATVANTQWVGGLDEPHWFISLAFEEDRTTYSYKVLVPKRQPPKDLAGAVAALRRLTGL